MKNFKSHLTEAKKPTSLLKKDISKIKKQLAGDLLNDDGFDDALDNFLQYSNFANSKLFKQFDEETAAEIYNDIISDFSSDLAKAIKSIK